MYSSLQSDGTLHKVFQDYHYVTVRGGSGGSGASLFLSLYRKEFAGPSGGDGGNGGHVIFEASPDVKSLIDVKKTVIGKVRQRILLVTTVFQNPICTYSCVY